MNRRRSSALNRRRRSSVAGPDGGWGYMVALATGTADALISTFAYVLSPLFIELRRHFNASAGETSWVLSLQYISFVLACIGTSSGDQIGARKTVIIFGCIASVGILISSFATSIYFLYATVGLITGIGFAGSYSPMHVTNARYFPTRFPLVNGIAMLGPGIALFIFPPILQLCVDLYGWRGAFMVESAIIANLCVCGALLRPLKPTLGTIGGEKKETINNTALNREVWKEEDDDDDDDGSGKAPCICSLCEDYCELCRSPRFIIYLCSVLCVALAVSGALVHLQPRATEAQVGTAQQTSFLVSISGICSLFGRLGGSSLLVHFNILSSTSTFILSTMIIGVGCFIPNLADTYIGFTVLSGLLGVGSGMCFAVVLVCARHLVEFEQVSYSFAMVLSSFGVGLVIGAPIAGLIYDVSQHYDYAYYTLGAFSLLGGILLIPGQIVEKCKKRNDDEPTSL
ncbi:monocarboxylate transporter 12-like [Glandiceps talaboti]